jgi:ribosomal protein S18 acetylase RimI-like enzyme
MQVVYFKRYRMEADLPDPPPTPTLPSGYEFVPWREDLLDLHAEVKHRSFLDEIDATVFPNLAQLAGCVILMRAIRRRSNFVPAATWLLKGPDGFCGTVQGLRERGGCGAVQNLGIVPGQRGLGLGTALLLRALHGFRLVGLRKAMLEVTARNEGAVRLYRRLGFRCRKTVYKAVDVPAPCEIVI